MGAMRYGGAGDAARTLRLLWTGQAPRAAGTPGPKPGLRLDAIVQAAIAIADERGEASISMRAVAGRLSCTPMALYSHVGGRAELLDLMYDRVHEGFPRPRPGSWPERIGEWAEALLDLYVRHPWIGEVSLARPVLGPHEQQVLETLLEAMQPAGLGWADASAIVSALFSLARTTARTIREARAAERETGRSDRDWWQARMRALAEVAPDFAERFPHWTALARAGAPAAPTEADPSGPTPIMERAARRVFRRGVELLLAGTGAG
jgi:AcrR family transcriptional regulator